MLVVLEEIVEKKWECQYTNQQLIKICAMICVAFPQTLKQKKL